MKTNKKGVHLSSFTRMVNKRGDFEHTIEVREVNGQRVAVKVYAYPLVPLPQAEEEIADG